ncbi:Hypothetical predicted protein [Octopus vulgaris]|uniref:Uncharacterized protein n=1 Tax=Octopus vulgaris TaxID=6645 RepID=A0AA36MFM7_OCTVU|nr:Hypothetical predicted protein [Octopus vulgaris]
MSEEWKISQGADLVISGHNQPCLPETLKKQPIVFFRVTDVDEQEKSKILLANVLPSDQKDVYTKMHVPKEKEEREKSLLFAKVQQIVCDKLKRRGVRTVTGLGQHYEKLCQKSSAPQHFLVKSDLEEGLKVFHIELPQTVIDLASMLARTVGDQVACWFPEVSVANHKTIRITELQQPGSLLIARTITIASMNAIEALSISSNMPIEVTSHKEKVPVVRQ